MSQSTRLADTRPRNGNLEHLTNGLICAGAGATYRGGTRISGHLERSHPSIGTQCVAVRCMVVHMVLHGCVACRCVAVRENGTPTNEKRYLQNYLTLLNKEWACAAIDDPARSCPLLWVDSK